MSYRLKRKQKIHFIAQKRHGIQMGLTDVQQTIRNTITRTQRDK